MLQEGFDILNYTLLLILFRPRKVWPEFFGLGLNQFIMNRQPGNNSGEQARALKMPITTFHILNSDVFDTQSVPCDLDHPTKDFFGLLSVKDPVLIINPCDICDP